jgi:hypothetical protein
MTAGLNTLLFTCSTENVSAPGISAWRPLDAPPGAPGGLLGCLPGPLVDELSRPLTAVAWPDSPAVTMSAAAGQLSVVHYW